VTRAPLTIFVHVPKTAGTAVTLALRTNEPYTERSGNVFKGGRGGTAGNPDYARTVTRTLADPKVGLIAGHTTMGIDAHIPANRERRYVTMLRDPVERALSHYYAAVHSAQRPRREPRPRKPGKPVRPVRPLLSAEADHDTAFSGVAFIPDNLHVRMLCGDPLPFGPVTTGMLEAAKQNLAEQIHVFGITERFDESIALIARRLGHRSLFHSSQRGNDERPRGDAVPVALAAAARRHNDLDLELYAYACELFDRATELDELDFRLDVAATRRVRGAPDGPRDFPGNRNAWDLLVDERARRLRTEFDLANERLTVADLHDPIRDRHAHLRPWTLHRLHERLGPDHEVVRALAEKLGPERSASELEQGAAAREQYGTYPTPVVGLPPSDLHDES
jgi:hypothetical protein